MRGFATPAEYVDGGGFEDVEDEVDGAELSECVCRILYDFDDGGSTSGGILAAGVGIDNEGG